MVSSAGSPFHCFVKSGILLMPPCITVSAPPHAPPPGRWTGWCQSVARRRRGRSCKEAEPSQSDRTEGEPSKVPAVRIRSDSFGTLGVIGEGVLAVPSGGLSCPRRKMLQGRAAGKGGWAGCSLDPGGCLSLQQILASFTAPISEEHAWAVIHQVR